MMVFIEKCLPIQSFWYAFSNFHDDVMKWKHFPRYWPFLRGIQRSPVNSPHKGQWRGALMFSLICVWINGWVNNREAGDLRRHHAHYDVIIMICLTISYYVIPLLIFWGTHCSLCSSYQWYFYKTCDWIELATRIIWKKSVQIPMK